MTGIEPALPAWESAPFGLICRLTCRAAVPRVTVSTSSSPRLMARYDTTRGCLTCADGWSGVGIPRRERPRRVKGGNVLPEPLCGLAVLDPASVQPEPSACRTSSCEDRVPEQVHPGHLRVEVLIGDQVPLIRVRDRSAGTDDRPAGAEELAHEPMMPHQSRTATSLSYSVAS
jgi:hypothetical protein